MTDKELIKQEIKRLKKESLEGKKDYYDYYDGVGDACDEMLQFIDSLPEEPAIENLEAENPIEGEFPYTNPSDTLQGEIENIFGKLSVNGIFSATKEGFSEVISHFAEWQKEKDYKMYVHVPLKDIHDAWQELKKNKPDIENYPSVCFQKGADWRENQMKEALQTEYEKGRFDMREEMMKDAMEGEVVYKIGNAEIAPTDVRYKVMSDRVYIPNVKLGDKVKIIICKTEQQ